MDWKLTRDACGEPVVDTFRHDPDEDLATGFSLIRLMAEDPDSGIEELAPGVWYQSKIGHRDPEE